MAASNAFTRGYRRFYQALGFQKLYNSILFILCIGYFMGFTLSRLEYLNFYGIFCPPSQSTGASPGECFYYLQGKYKIGIILHLGCILPAAFLACFQFVPVIRQRALLFHRLNGYLIILLYLCSCAGVLVILRHSFGGDVATQTGSGFLIIISFTSIFLAYWNIKVLQIDQHRAWMLRAWVYLSCIVTTRIIMMLSTLIISSQGSYYTARPCGQIAYILGQPRTVQAYPACLMYFNGTNPDQQTLVHANFDGGPEEIGASLGVPFGSAIWLSIAIHAIAVEVYLRLTPAESARLRSISYDRQLQAGYKRPGDAGLTVNRFGDVEDPNGPIVTHEMVKSGNESP